MNRSLEEKMIQTLTEGWPKMGLGRKNGAVRNPDLYERVLQNRLHLYIAADASMVHVEDEVIALV
jgi:hypothetical protein